MSYNGCPYDEDNESELYSAESHTEKWSGKTHEDDDIQTFAEWLIEEYNSNPSAFSEKRDEVYSFGYVSNNTKHNYDQWTLMDTDRGIVYTVFDTEEQLADFLKPSRARRAIKRVIMDRIVECDPDKSRSFMLDKCLDTSTIALIKDCVCATPKNNAREFFDDELALSQIAWKIVNRTACREAELCAELYEAGIQNEITKKATFPF